MADDVGKAESEEEQGGDDVDNSPGVPEVMRRNLICDMNGESAHGENGENNCQAEIEPDVGGESHGDCEAGGYLPVALRYSAFFTS